jgi:hypothetical protein
VQYECFHGRFANGFLQSLQSTQQDVLLFFGRPQGTRLTEKLPVAQLVMTQLLYEIDSNGQPWFLYHGFCLGDDESLSGHQWHRCQWHGWHQKTSAQYDGEPDQSVLCESVLLPTQIFPEVFQVIPDRGIGTAAG